MKPPPFIYDADFLCLDLVNTRLIREGEAVDLLTDFGALVAWLEGAGLLDRVEAARTLERWDGTAAGGRAWQLAVDLREAVRRHVDRLLDSEPTDDRALSALNGVLEAIPLVFRVVAREGDVALDLRSVTDDAAGLLLPVARSAVELSTESDPSRLGRCDGSKCVLYFYDRTRNRSRRWCSMGRCGARAKSAAYYRRRHGDSG